MIEWLPVPSEGTWVLEGPEPVPMSVHLPLSDAVSPRAHACTWIKHEHILSYEHALFFA